MKTKFILASFVAALSGFAGLATTAKAGTDFHINLNLGLPRPPVIVVSSPSHNAPGYAYGNNRGFDPHYVPAPAPRGYWKEVVVKTWVPAQWTLTRDRRGREIRTLAPGYFAYRTDRVWVDNGHGAYGYASR
jgi:hypothetical protein